MTSTDSSCPVRRTPTNDEIPLLLEALAASGGNVAGFAQQQGVTPWKLYEARRLAAGRVRRRERRDKGVAFVPVRVAEERAPSAPLELVLGAGRRLLIPVGFDEPTLRRVVGVLASC